MLQFYQNRSENLQSRSQVARPVIYHLGLLIQKAPGAPWGVGTRGDRQAEAQHLRGYAPTGMPGNKPAGRQEEGVTPVGDGGAGPSEQGKGWDSAPRCKELGGHRSRPRRKQQLDELKINPSSMSGVCRLPRPRKLKGPGSSALGCGGEREHGMRARPV